jgi:hypothetical protein
MRIRIRIKEDGNWKKLTNKTSLLPFKKAFIPSLACSLTYYYFKYIFYVKIQPSVALKPDKDPDPDGSALVWLPGTESALT